MPRIHSSSIWSRSQSFCSNTWRNTNRTSCRSSNRTFLVIMELKSKFHSHEDSKSTSGGFLGIFGSRTCVTISWMYKKQKSVSHSCSESEILSFDAGLRMDGLHAFDLWDVVNSTKTQTNPASGNSCKTGTYSRNTAKSERKGIRDVDQLLDVDYVPTNTPSSEGDSQFYILLTTKQWSRWSLKVEARQWDLCQKTHRGRDELVVWQN